ncbi:hypothetical protein ACFL7D_10780, partial [candidate division KSB1 bacterium]
SKIKSRTYLPIIFDPGMTMRSGAENIITLHNKLTSAQNKLLKNRLFSESNVLGKSGGMAYRYLKYGLLDFPMDYFSVVLAHEYYGHGARYRELNMDDIHYAFELPPPYGGGGGEATNTKPVSISLHELLAIWHGGIDVHSVINRKLSMRWMAADEVNYREASQYFWSFQIMYDYIQSTNEDLADGTNDNDPRAYVRYLNANSGYSVNNLKMSVKDLKSKIKIGAANPFLLYSMYSLIKTYLWDGSSSGRIPMLHLGKIDYLPALRAGLTPFGIQYHFENYFHYNRTTSFIDFSYGEQSFFDSWGGIGINIQNIYEPENFSFDLNLNVWDQPEFQFGNNPMVSKGGGLGGAFSVRGYYNFPNTQYPVSALLELGYKSTGFLEGYEMDSSPIFMLGLALRN